MNSVLLVEDEPLLLQELAETVPWKRHGFCLEASASSGEEAYKLYLQRPCDLIISDIRLPGGSGLELIRECAPRAAIIITGYDQFDYARSALRIGVDDFLLKPIDDRELEEALRRVKLRLAGERRIENPAIGTERGADSKARHVAAAEDFIRRKYRSDISLAAAARELEISESYLSRIVREQRGRTFVELLTAYRLKIALALLQDPRMRVGEIAELCGFQDQGYFSRIFKRYYGSTPSSYRQGLEGDALLGEEGKQWL